MTDEVQPRVWVGEPAECHWWRWSRHHHRRGVWGFRTGQLTTGDIFVPGNQSEPTIDPAEMETIRTCKVVDW